MQPKSKFYAFIAISILLVGGAFNFVKCRSATKPAGPRQSFDSLPGQKGTWIWSEVPTAIVIQDFNKNWNHTGHPGQKDTVLTTIEIATNVGINGYKTITAYKVHDFTSKNILIDTAKQLYKPIQTIDSLYFGRIFVVDSISK